MKLRRIEASYEALAGYFQGHDMEAVDSDVPADIRIVSIDLEPARRVLWFTVESESFADVPESNVIPQWTPSFTRRTRWFTG